MFSSRKLLKISIFISLFFLILLFWIGLFKEDPWLCPKFEHAFLNKKYDVEICKGGYNNDNPHYSARIRIYSKSAVLLGQREFSVWTAPISERIDYFDDKIIYNHAIIDGADGVPDIETKTLQFPLTKRDWFEANLDRILFSP